MKSFQQYCHNRKLNEADEPQIPGGAMSNNPGVSPYQPPRLNPLLNKQVQQLNPQVISQQATQLLKPIFYQLDNLVKNGDLNKSSFLQQDAQGNTLGKEEQKDVLVVVLSLIAKRYGFNQIHELLV